MHAVFKTISKPAAIELGAQWDAMARTRFDQLFQGRDKTQCHILCPAIRDMVRGGSPRILDAGCGVGYLTAVLSPFATEIIGIDPSAESVALAKTLGVPNAAFSVSSLTQFAEATPSKFDLIVANLVVMSSVDIFEFFESARNVIMESGRIVFSITNPMAWPRVCGYEDAEWFSYNREIFVSGPFRISSEQHISFQSWHAHRPLAMYHEALLAAGFRITKIVEPFPKGDEENLFAYKWTFPRYIIMEAALAHG